MFVGTSWLEFILMREYIKLGLSGYFLSLLYLYLLELFICSISLLFFSKSSQWMHIQLECSFSLQRLLFFWSLQLMLVSPLIRILHIFKRFEETFQDSSLLVGVNIPWLHFYLPIFLSISLWVLFWVIFFLKLISRSVKLLHIRGRFERLLFSKTFFECLKF